MLPPLLIAGSPDDDLASLTRLLTRIGLANPARVCLTLDDARQFLTSCASSRLPVVALVCVPGQDASGVALIEWMRTQPDSVGAIDVIALVPESGDDSRMWCEAAKIPFVRAPVDMHPLIAAMKSLALPEKARIDPATLTVQVELWPRAGGVSRQ